ncbi:MULTISPECIES: TrbC family F-type conjugative pilus assembly protein [Shewanella]|uniref:TrbC family F-type conjugative pilus assembly protein n=1 Tax=Shewanella TaxID=22 RepID=UPI0021776972|nr:TrbC family F-type conjugative pilus assembly protein [Shewanella xiamenensis]MCT8869265.1 hypothetical protein [Shewanella xiamenensis]MCT8873892.1 hypothetical protein [Shewanella xiamenensis]MCT8877558.1 hypothetical protein [Shewanella xiamenensis]UWH39992.1 hypothetical protein KXJ80_00375 [Shewanella xiamenensis]BDQ68432.1 hypothetical protein NUITMVS2_42450 [Shewanella xiamenensis]
MQCYKKWVIALFLVLAPLTDARSLVLQQITPEQAIKMAKEKGWLEGLNLSGEETATSKDVEEFINNAQKQIKEIAGDALSADAAVTRPSSVTFMFVSLSMPRASLIDALKNAASSNVTVYINGMFEGDKNILETMARLDEMSKDMLFKPTVKFGPTWFKKYNIQRVPALVYDDAKSQIIMTGMTQMAFFNEKVATVKQSADFGEYGATFPVKELSLIEQIKRRMETIDWEQKKQAATQNYWKKRAKFPLELAAKDDVFYIDPTVTIKRDVINRAGVVLARAGSKFNPLAEMPNAYLRLYILDPTDPKQLAWLDTKKESFDYRDQIIINQLDAERGWDGLAELRRRYGRDVFLLEQELITKFALKAVPSIVSMENNFIKVSEYSVRDKL